jgi:hypothetical protein
MTATTVRAETATLPLQRLASPAAWGAALALAAEAVVATVWDVDDHAVGAGRLSEALVGLAFACAAVSLAGFAPVPSRSGTVARLLCLPAVAGTTGIAVATLTITVTGREWSEPLVTAILLLALVGLVVHAVVATRAGSWPWWAGALVALTLPVMFLVPNPLNGWGMAAIWAVAGWAGRGHPRVR